MRILAEVRQARVRVSTPEATARQEAADRGHDRRDTIMFAPYEIGLVQDFTDLAINYRLGNLRRFPVLSSQERIYSFLCAFERN